MVPRALSQGNTLHPLHSPPPQITDQGLRWAWAGLQMVNHPKLKLHLMVAGLAVMQQTMFSAGQAGKQPFLKNKPSSASHNSLRNRAVWTSRIRMRATVCEFFLLKSGDFYPYMRQAHSVKHVMRGRLYL
jgi:hypothetical protein